MSEKITSASDVGTLMAMPIGKMMDTNVLMMGSTKTVAEAIDLMQKKNAKVILVSNEGEAIGIVSKTDIIFKVVAKHLPINKVKLREIMSSPVFTIPSQSTLQDALSYMDKYSIRQLVIILGSSVSGMVTRDSIYEKVKNASISTIESLADGAPLCIINPKAIKYVKDLESAKVVCPYCESPFDDKTTLSKHIDRLHGGAGLLEGDTRQY